MLRCLIFSSFYEFSVELRMCRFSLLHVASLKRKKHFSPRVRAMHTLLLLQRQPLVEE